MKYLKARYDYPVVDIKAFHELFPNSYGNKPKKKKIIIKGLTLLDETSEEEFETLEKGRYIKLSSLSGNEGNILTDITNRTLYTRHIPDSYASGCHLNAARFVMITAAFEWEFKRLYPGGITKSDKTQKIENEAAEAIQKLIDGSTTRALKKNMNFLKSPFHSLIFNRKLFIPGTNSMKLSEHSENSFMRLMMSS